MQKKTKTKADHLNAMSPEAQLAYLKQACRQLQTTLERTMRQNVAKELADALLHSGKGPWKHPDIAAVFSDGLVRRNKSFPQKRGATLVFYTRVFSLMAAAPARVLEIGVKGGASLELWKAMFPEAHVVGADIAPRQTVLSQDITIVEADQAKPENIAAIGERFGPFDLVIDDASHIGAHMVDSLRVLLPHLNPGALYVLEDILSEARLGDGPGDDGKIGELVAAGLSFFGQHGGDWAAPASSISEAAQAILPRMAMMLLGDGALAFVVRDSRPSPWLESAATRKHRKWSESEATRKHRKRKARA